MATPPIKALRILKTGRVALLLTIILLITSAGGQELPPLNRIPDEIMDAELRPLDNSAPVKLRSYQGKVVVLVLWANWGPNTFSMPALNKLNKDYRRRGVEVIGLAPQDDDPKYAPAPEALRRLGVDFKNLRMTNEISEALNPKHIVPITMVMIGDGTIFRRLIGWDHKRSPRTVRGAVKDALEASKPKAMGKT